MTKKLDTKIKLARYFDEKGKEHKITIQNYLDFVANPKQHKKSIANFIYQRLYGRYLKPFDFKDRKFKKGFKNGFSIMANCCLLIETLESFKKGWGDSNRKSEQAFIDFLTTDKHFSELKSRAKDFYRHIRCGILHQGETTGGWTITRKGGNLFDRAQLKIDAFKFSERLKESLTDYATSLKNEQWDSELWDNCRVKMRKIINNCQK